MKQSSTEELNVAIGTSQPKASFEHQVLAEVAGFAPSSSENAIDIKKSSTDSISSENFQDSIFNSIGDAIVVINMDLSIMRVNQATLDLTGFSEAELIGQSIEILSKNKGFLSKIIDRKLQKKSVINGIEAHCLKKDGSLFPISLSASKIYDAQSDTYNVVCIAQDITKKKRLEAESKVIFEISQGISTTSNLDELLELIHHSLKKILYAENCFVALHDKKTGLFTMRFFVDQFDDPPPPLELVRSCTRYVFKTERPLLMNKEMFDSLVEHDEVDLVGSPPVCWIGTPLRTPTEIIGVLVVQHYEDRNAYDQRALDLLTSVGDQIAMAIERKQAEEALSKSEERFQLVTRATNDAIWDWDLVTNNLWWNQGFQKLFGYSADEVGTTIESWTTRLHPDDLERITTDIHQAIDSGQQKWSNEYRFLRRDGSYAFIIDRGYVVHDRKGKPVRMLGSMMDVTERKSLEDQLTHQALHDSLTKLANRVLFHDRVKHALSKLNRNKTSLAVLFLDLDNFKTINDSMGHAAGDQLLVSAAERLRACLRSSDTPARLGGDEFAVLIEEAKHVEEAISVAERLKEMLCAPFLIEGKEVFVGTSIGIAITETGNEDPEELLRNADTAMYMAKSQGKGRYVVFEEKMHEALMERIELEEDLRRAVENKEFLLHYQPIIDLQTKQIMGMEALVRWNHPHRGLIPPNKFIPVAEETSQIIPLGEWILNEACHQAKAWQDQYNNESKFSISVNLSIRQFQQEKLVEMVAAALESSGLAAEHLVLEITESLMIQNTEATIRKLQELKKLGIKLAIDDFGTGYSSLSYLQRFPLDILKIDKSFVDKISYSKEGIAVARAIIMMSDTLHLKTVAEGIEHSEQIDALQDLGCGLGQGFHFAKPLNKEDMHEFLLNANLNKDPNWLLDQIMQEDTSNISEELMVA